MVWAFCVPASLRVSSAAVRRRRHQPVFCLHRFTAAALRRAATATHSRCRSACAAILPPFAYPTSNNMTAAFCCAASLVWRDAQRLLFVSVPAGRSPFSEYAHLLLLRHTFAMGQALHCMVSRNANAPCLPAAAPVLSFSRCWRNNHVNGACTALPRLPFWFGCVQVKHYSACMVTCENAAWYVGGTFVPNSSDIT